MIYFKTFIILASLTWGSCSDLNSLFYHDGIYMLNRYEVAISCSDQSSERAGFGLESHLVFETPYFKLEYEGISVASYILSPCKTEKAEQCESLYFFDPDDVHVEGDQLTIDETKECGEEKRKIQAHFIHAL